MNHRHRIEEEYERLNRELKSNTEYNMKRYLEEKKRIRAITGIVSKITPKPPYLRRREATKA